MIDGDRATGVVYCHGEIEVGDDWVHQAILYRDTYRRDAGEGWRFVRRVHELWYGVALDRSPLDQPAADWPANAVGRGTVPREVLHLNDKGVSIGSLDNPDQVDADIQAIVAAWELEKFSWDSPFTKFPE